MWFIYMIIGLIAIPLLALLLTYVVKYAKNRKFAAVGQCNKIKTKISALSIISFITLFIYSVILISLLIYAVTLSINDETMVVGGKLGSIDGYMAFPNKFLFSNYAEAFKEFFIPVNNNEKIYIEGMFLNSVLYGLGLGFCGALAPCLVAYAVTRFGFKFNKIVDGIVMVTIILPIVGALPSQINIVYNILHWNDSIPALWFMGFSFANMYYFIFKAAFNSVPSGITEAASIDGASNLRIFLTIALPLVRVTFFSIMLLVFVSSWNNYSNIIAFAPNKPTAAYGVYYLLTAGRGGDFSVPQSMALAMTLMLPVMLMYILLNKKLLGNLTMGGVKG